ncbi:MAG: STAS domain-containing protein [Bacteroidales bacterium]|nr:STAS domain-containing protein [Bacteroidales bacterium]MDY0196813.1 STAS domain-containing protein [Tenuifilaceae bacterium]
MAKTQRITLKSQAAKGKGKTSEVGIIIIQGELTIDNAQELKAFLLENLKKHSQIQVKINEVDSIDLTAVQLLQSFLWDAKQEQKSINFEMKLSEDHRILLERSGFETFLTLKN